jgi:hypothetical protein
MPNGNDHPTSGLDLLSELAERQRVLEGKMDTVLDFLSRFRDQGGDLDIAHVNHVMQKHFFHDQPERAADVN